jgi:hypothetical protein
MEVIGHSSVTMQICQPKISHGLLLDITKIINHFVRPVYIISMTVSFINTKSFTTTLIFILVVDLDFSLWYCTAVEPVVHAAAATLVNLQNLWDNIERGQALVLGKKPSRGPFFFTTNLTQIDLESNYGLRREKPATASYNE